jgi:hypothetical protein
MIFLMYLSGLWSIVPEPQKFQNDSIISDSSPVYYGKSNKTKEQVLVLYPSRSYAYFSHVVDKRLLVDSGEYKKKDLSNRLIFKSYSASNNSNPFLKEKSKIVNDQINLGKSNVIFKKIDEKEAAKTIALFKGVEITQKSKNKIPVSISSKGYSIERIESNSKMAEKIKFPDNAYFLRAQQLADSLYGVEKTKRPISQNARLLKLTQDIVGFEKNDSVIVVKLCQWIVSNFEYYLQGTVNPDELIDAKKTRCEGYANFLLELCKIAGVPCIKVTGLGDNEITPRYEMSKIDLLHAWNMVKINGQWRHVDVTWLDPVWPKGYERENVVLGKEYYFNPLPEKFVFGHLPEVNGLKMTSLGASSYEEFYESPVLNQIGYAIQYLGDYSNRIVTNKETLEFYFYSSESQKLNCSFGKLKESFSIELNEGVNKITIKTPVQSSEIVFSNSLIKAVFFVIPDNSKLNVLSQARNKAEHYQHTYYQEFYEEYMKALQSSTFVFHPDLKDEERSVAVWKTILKSYDGRNPSMSWFISYKDHIRMRFYIPDLKINDKDVFLECRVHCTREQVSTLDSEHYPTSDWRFGLANR